MATSVLQVDDLAVRYGASVRALEGVTIGIEPGETVALLGANGAGKTTLLRAVSGLLPHHGGTITAGHIELFGARLPQGSPTTAVRAGLAQVMEGRRLFRHLTVEENILLGAATVTRKEARRRAGEMFERFPIIGERRGDLAGLLSGGQQQIVAIARALVSRPRLLILDEPSLGLSPVAIQGVHGVLADLEGTGLSLLLVEQNVELALALADRAYIMQRGTVIASGPAAGLGGTSSIRDLYLGSAHTVGGERSIVDAPATTLGEVALPWLQ